MASKRISILLVAQLLLTSLATLVVSAEGEPTTTITLQSSYYGNLSNGDSVYVSQNPVFSLSVSLANNSLILNTEYEITKDGQTTNANYSTPVTII